MKAVAVFSLVLASVAFAQQPPMNNQRVMELVKAGVSESELERIIRTAPDVTFMLTPAATTEMMQAGVSEEAIKVMAARLLYAPSSGSTASVAGVAPQTQAVSHNHHRARMWIIIGAMAAGGAVGGYYLSNPHIEGIGVRPGPGQQF